VLKPRNNPYTKTLAAIEKNVKMKKYLLIIIVLSVLWSCNNSTKKERGIEEITSEETLIKTDSTEPQTAKTEVVKNIKAKINIESIKECAEQGITSFNMDSITDTKKYLDNSIVDNALGKIPVNEKKDWFLKADKWERFSCYQWEENHSYFLFTLLQKDESCCLTMYLCVSDKSGQLLTIRQLGLSGGDGGWFENDWGERIEFGKFKLFYDSYYDEDKFENGVDLGYTREHEYTELQIGLEEKSFKIDTLNYVKTDTLIVKK